MMSAFLARTAAALEHASLPLAALALALHMAGLVITAERWRFILGRMGSPISLWRAVLVNLAGIFVRNVTPASGIGGDAVRVGLFKAAGAPLGDATATLLCGRLVEVPAIAALVLIGLPAIGAAAERSRAALIVVVVIAAGAALVAAARRPSGSRLAAWRIRLGVTAPPPGALTVAALWAAGSWFETMIRLMVVCAALGVRLTVPQAAALAVFQIVGGLVPTVGSLGAIESSLMAGLLIFGVPAGTATAITIVERAITYAISTAIGGAALAALGGWDIVRSYRSKRT
jgi:undecaprenyl-diphosphatase